ncbi:MFS transporter [Prauserella endophytica]|uniref:MFS transporter n=1 Tax=Prauserella endophytica TaxID=1592324 RepID=A0ABY2RZI3_9PSEU|nr:MFS transporter [Prauserella endophytica]TKG64918.1 MFS transporter [Prauserella endophytica]
MSASTPVPDTGTRPSFTDRLGLPRPLVWGFVGVLIFMIGDGVESNYLSTFLVGEGFAEGDVATTVSTYGVFVAIGSWLAGTLSAMLGPRRVMLGGAVLWVSLETVLLCLAIPSGSALFVTVVYGLRGVGYPFFAYAFLVWLTAATPAHQRGTSVGWFWFAFGAGLPTLGSLAASASIPLVGEYGTFWVGLGLVALGALCALAGVRDLRHAGPDTAEGRSSLGELVRGVTILWREPRVSAGAFVRLVNTAPNFALFVIAPIFFTQTVGFSQGSYLLLVTCVYTTNIFANLLFGIVGDRFGWRRTVTWFGCVMCAVGALLLYYVPLAVGPNFVVALLCWMVFGVGLSGFVPLTALMPGMVQLADRGSSLAIYTLAAGLSAFVGPAIAGMLGGTANMAVIIWTFAGLYLLAALVSFTLRSEVDPGDRKAGTGE